MSDNEKKEPTLTELQNKIADCTDIGLGKIRSVFPESKKDDAGYYADRLDGATSAKGFGLVGSFFAAVILGAGISTATAEDPNKGLIIFGGGVAVASAGVYALGRQSQKSLIKSIGQDIGAGPKP